MNTYWQGLLATFCGVFIASIPIVALISDGNILNHPGNVFAASLLMAGGPINAWLLQHTFDRSGLSLPQKPATLKRRYYRR